MKKRYLFYLEHPAKVHFHKIQINHLLKNGHHVDVLINTKDILEDLVKEEGWKYTNLFPKTRKIKGVHVYIAAFINLFTSIYKVFRYTWGKKYDLMVGDVLVHIGWLRRIPNIYATDDVLDAVPEQIVFFLPAKHILAPKITDLGRFMNKKIPYYGYKALAHLHPNHFMPDRSKLSNDLSHNEKFFLIRCTGFGATHDINKKGIHNDLLTNMVNLLEPFGRVLITSERELPDHLEKHLIKIKKSDISHYIAFAHIFIGDSTTMSTEAAVLGTPSIEFDDYFHEIEQMIELEQKYQLIHCFRTFEEEKFLQKITELTKTSNLKEIYSERRQKLINDTIDVSAFLIWLFENYPTSYQEFKNNPDIQKQFK
jgi:predicted glycosyltransferase